MKEKEFLKELEENGFKDGFKQGIYYGLEDNGEVIFDERSMLEEFEGKIEEIKSILGEE